MRRRSATQIGPSEPRRANRHHSRKEIPVASHVKQNFADQRVVMDGETFENCVFTHCQLIYSGGKNMHLVGCTFDAECTFHVEDAAARTMAFLRGAYHNMGPGGTRLVEETFNDIRLQSQPADPSRNAA